MTKPFRYTITPRGEVRLEMNGTAFFLNRRRAAELLRTIGAAVREQGADSGPTTPRIIRTREELTALDPDTPLVLGTGLFTVAAAARVFVNVQALLPAVVIATGDQVREAQQALAEADREPETDDFHSSIGLWQPLPPATWKEA